MKTTPETIAELKRLLAEATQWTWEAHADMSPNGKHRRAWITADGKRVADTASCNLHRPHDRYPQDAHNAELIAAAVNALPALLAHIEAAQQQITTLREALERVATGLSPASIAVQCHGNIARHDANLVALAGVCGQIAMCALADTEVKP
jgi:hypothetical protein